eukprot:Em0011g1190a
MTTGMEKNKTFISLIVMALTAALGVCLLFIGCAIHFPGNAGAINWWGMFVLIFYLLSPCTTGLARRLKGADYCLQKAFVSGFGYLQFWARKTVIQSASAGLIAAANLFVFGTVYTYFAVFGRDEDSWGFSSF